MERKGDDTLRTQDLETSLDISNLLYLEKKESNVVVERAQKIQYADSPVNQNDQVVVVNLQTGSDYISWRDSWLRVVVNSYDATGSAIDDASWGAFGSVLNVFRTIRVIGRAGDVIAQIDRSNLLNYYRVNYEHTDRWKRQQGEALIGWTTSATEIPLNAEYLIPLQLLCPFFEHEQLAPNMLCRGMRLECTLESPQTAFQQEAGTLTSYTLSGVQLLLDSYTLTSGATNWLNERSANSGLVMTYKDYENSHFVIDKDATSYAFEVRKTASMANSALTIIRDSDKYDVEGKVSDPLQENSFGSYVPRETDEFQARVSSLYLPVQPLRGAKQFFAQWNYAQDKLNTRKEMGLEYTEYTGSVGVGRGVAVLPVQLSRYWLEGSGLAINNSATLSVVGTCVPAPALLPQDKQVDIFLEHTRSLTIFLQNLRRSD